jgi:hypothetical protein
VGRQNIPSRPDFGRARPSQFAEKHTLRIRARLQSCRTALRLTRALAPLFLRDQILGGHSFRASAPLFLLDQILGGHGLSCRTALRLTRALAPEVTSLRRRYVFRTTGCEPVFGRTGAGDPGLVRVNFQEWPLEIKARPVEAFTDDSSTQRPLIRNVREWGTSAITWATRPAE